MIFNVSTGDNTSEEVSVMLTEFIGEVNSQLSTFKSEINTLLTGFKGDVNSQVSALTSAVNNVPKGAVKSVQRGVHSGSATDNITITINTVNPSKCMVLLQRTRDTTNLPSLVSITSTSFTVTTSSAVYSSSPNAPSPFSWQVIEFY